MSDNNSTTVSQDSPYARWIEGVKNYDPDVWNDLLTSHGDRLRGDIKTSLQKRGLSVELTDDIQQETWVTVLRNIHKFEWQGDHQFYHWLRVVSLNHIRKMKREQERQVSIDDFEDALSSIELEQFYAKYSLRDAGIEDQIILREKMIHIEYAVRQLKPQEAEILLRWLMGEKPKTLAVHYKKRHGTISMLLMRAKEKIRAQLEKLEAGTQRDKHDD